MRRRDDDDEREGIRLEKVECVGGLWDSLFAFFKFFCVSVILSTMIFFYCCYGVRGRSKAMALQRNVVYTVTRWVDGWMNGPMNGWMDVTKNTEAHEWGLELEQELDACLITVSLCFFFLGVNILVVFFLSFMSSCTGEKERLLRKPCRHEDSPVLFCHFFP